MNDRRIGQNLRTRRLEIGMSQERLAEILGVTFQQVQKYEKGVNRMAGSRLFDAAQALGVRIEELFAGCAPMGRDLNNPELGDNAIADSLATVEGVEVQRLFAAIRTPVVRKRVVGLLRAVVSEAAS
jgi:transcriptional regulator with XRE-family HTH domain